MRRRRPRCDDAGARGRWPFTCAASLRGFGGLHALAWRCAARRRQHAARGRRHFLASPPARWSCGSRDRGRRARCAAARKLRRALELPCRRGVAECRYPCRPLLFRVNFARSPGVRWWQALLAPGPGCDKLPLFARVRVLRLCLVIIIFYKNFHILHHTESLYVCMEH